MVLLEKLSSLIRKNYTSILLLGIIFGLFLLNSRYVDYPDEYINLLGGKVILNGGLPYRDFWDHHLPLAWYISSIFLFLSGKSFVLTRVLWAVAQFGGFALLGRWIYKKHPSLVKPFLAFFVLYPAASLYFWFHLFLANCSQDRSQKSFMRTVHFSSAHRLRKNAQRDSFKQIRVFASCGTTQ